MRISVMERMVSTSRFLLWSVTVVFFVRTWYMYLDGKEIGRRDAWSKGGERQVGVRRGRGKYSYSTFQHN